MIRRTLVLLFLPLTAFADDPFACVDPDVLDAFVGSWYESPRYSTGLPPEAAGLALPAQFELIGSMTAGSSTQVAYKSEQEAGAALARSIAALTDAGWKDRSAELGAFRGFHSESAPRFTHLCHESEAASLDVQTMKRPGDSLLLLSLQRLEDWRVCRTGTRLSLHPSLGDYLPDLEVPDDAVLHRNGSEGGGDEYSATATLTTTSSRGELLRHFGEQIREQGWTPDSDWSGGMTSGTVWTRRGSKDQLLVGTMRIAEAGDEVFNVRFTVISAAPGDYSSGHSSSISASN